MAPQLRQTTSELCSISEVRELSAQLGLLPEIEGEIVKQYRDHSTREIQRHVREFLVRKGELVGSQQAVAFELGMTRSGYNKALNGRVNFTAPEIARTYDLAYRLRVEIPSVTPEAMGVHGYVRAISYATEAIRRADERTQFRAAGDGKPLLSESSVPLSPDVVRILRVAFGPLQNDLVAAWRSGRIADQKDVVSCILLDAKAADWTQADPLERFHSIVGAYWIPYVLAEDVLRPRGS
jgi:transcriptional regulator with XRE-family HTH domain